LIRSIHADGSKRDRVWKVGVLWIA